MENTVKVFIVEENKLLQQRTVAIVRQTTNLEVVGIADNLAQGFDAVLAVQPAVVLLDVVPVRKNIEPLITKLCQAVPQAIVICMNDRWHEEEAQRILAAGASAYLMKPFGKEELVDALAAIYQEQKAVSQQKDGKIIAFFTPKGGYGKSSLVVNMAIGLAEETGEKVGIVDANFQFGDIAVFCNVTPTASVFEAARDLAHLTPVLLNNYFMGFTPAIKVLAAPLRPEQGDLITSEQIKATLTMAQQLFSYIVVDTPSGFNDISLAVTKAADIVYVLCAMNTGLELDHLKRSLDYFKELGYAPDKLKVIINRVPRRSLAALRAVEEQINHPVVTLLPNDFDLAVTASNQGRPMIAVGPESGLVRGVMDIVKNTVAYDSSSGRDL
ncbi:MAG TPA: P-loop NTPase [Negativicutes bacterium]